MRSAFALIVCLAIAFEAIFTACAPDSTCLRESDCANGYSCIVGSCQFVEAGAPDGGADGAADAGDANAVADASADADAATVDADTDASDQDADGVDGDTDASDTDATDG